MSYRSCPRGSGETRLELTNDNERTRIPRRAVLDIAESTSTMTPQRGGLCPGASGYARPWPQRVRTFDALRGSLSRNRDTGVRLYRGHLRRERHQQPRTTTIRGRTGLSPEFGGNVQRTTCSSSRAIFTNRALAKLASNVLKSSRCYQSSTRVGRLLHAKQVSRLKCRKGAQHHTSVPKPCWQTDWPDDKWHCHCHFPPKQQQQLGMEHLPCGSWVWRTSWQGFTNRTDAGMLISPCSAYSQPAGLGLGPRRCANDLRMQAALGSEEMPGLRTAWHSELRRPRLPRGYGRVHAFHCYRHPSKLLNLVQYKLLSLS